MAVLAAPQIQKLRPYHPDLLDCECNSCHSFGLGHLPATSVILPLTPLVVVRAVILNGLAGIAFGYLFFTTGLESAMISHFTADLILHFLLAL